MGKLSQDSLYVREDAMPRLQVGDEAPQFSLPSIDGEIVCLDDYENVPLVLVLLRSRT